MEQKFPMEQGWLLCRETGGRAELTMEVPGGSRGLYRGYVLGERGLMDLGTLLPEGNVLRLRRTFPVERLRSQGCWPVTGGRVQMTYAFTGQPAAARPGVEGTGPSGDPVPRTRCWPRRPGPGGMLAGGRMGPSAWPTLGPRPSLSPDTGFLSGPCQAFARAAPCDLPISSRGGAHPPSGGGMSLHRGRWVAICPKLG
ncbi:MAG: hypothetical protein ACLSF6_06715 [Evtepia gabavorous]